MTIQTMSKIALAFAVGVSLSAGYVAIGGQRVAPAQVVVVQERCDQADRAEQVDSTAQPELPPLPAQLAHDPAYYVTDEHELAAMAYRCEVRDDDPAPLDDTIAAALGLSEAERESWELARARLGGSEAANEFIFVHALDPDGAANKTLAQFMQDREDHEASDRAIFRQLARERAGLTRPMTAKQLDQADVWTRALRFRASTGDMFATELSLELGRARATELRRMFGGWPGSGVRVIACADEAEANAKADGVRVEGELDHAIVRRVVQVHSAAIRECYEHGDGWEGQLAVEFVIGSDGKVGEVTLTDDATRGDAETRACVSAAIEGWIFPKPRNGTVRVSYPFAF